MRVCLLPLGPVLPPVAQWSLSYRSRCSLCQTCCIQHRQGACWVSYCCLVCAMLLLMVQGTWSAVQNHVQTSRNGL